MNRLSRLIANLAVKNLLHLFAIVWVSVIVLLSLFVRPDVIRAVGPGFWMVTVLPLFILLYIIWISFVVMVKRNAGLFAAARPARPRRSREHGKDQGSASASEMAGTRTAGLREGGRP